MSALLSLATRAASLDAEKMARRLRRAFFVSAAAGLLALTSYVLLLLAAFDWTWQVTGSFQLAAVACGLSTLVLCLVVLAVSRLLRWRERRRKAAEARANLVLASTAVGLLPKVLGPKTTLIAATAGAFAYYAFCKGEAASDHLS